MGLTPTTKLWRGASGATEKWFKKPEFWRSGIRSGRSQSMAWQGRTLWVMLAVGLIVLVAGFSPLWWHRSPAPVEVGVLLGTSDRTWADFVLAVDLAADERGLPFSIDSSRHECRVSMHGQPVVFRWYPEAGSRNIQFRVRQLCSQPKVPIAVVGASNSAMTDALAEELATQAKTRQTPVLLMTYGTADYLINKYRERAFRVGFNNSYQARTVVDRLRSYYRDRQISNPQLSAVLVQVLDDPFSVDLARSFHAELSKGFSVKYVSAPDSASGVEENFWTLSTCTGSFNIPNDEEKRLAQSLVQRMVANPSRQWVLVLPVGTGSFRRLSSALATALHEHPDHEIAEQARQNLVVLSGDSMNYYTFSEPSRSFLNVDKTPAPVILFSHVNPTDRTVVAPPDNHVPSRSLNRDVARALLDTLEEPSARTGPAALAEALERYRRPSDSLPFFANHERRDGGGAILVIPGRDRFHIELPDQWK